MERAQQLFFIPSPLVGHLIPTIQFARLLTSINHQISATIFIIKFPFDEKAESFTKSLPQISTPSLKFVELNLLEESYSHLLSSTTFLYDFIAEHKSKVRAFLEESSNPLTPKIAGIILDMFTISMIDVVNEFGLSSYMFFTSGASQLGLVLHLLSLRDDFNQDLTEYKNSDIDLSVPTFMNPVSTELLPSIIFDKEGGCRAFLDLTKRFREAKGIIVNTFLELESYALQALSKDNSIPHVYTAGPLLNFGSREEEKEAELIMKWLDSQPDLSVVFLCFGSKGCFVKDQVKEIAIALENSGHRFLWSLRRPAATNGRLDHPKEYENLEEVLPKGFLHRTSDVGKIIGWAPQAAILSHPAVGGFVSHCGWNSILESVSCGVPMAAWPIYAEQNANALQVVKEIGIAVEIKMDYRNDFRMKSEIVTADVIEDSIRRLLEQGNDIRNKVKEMKARSRLALEVGGSSHASVKSFLDNIVG